MALLQDLHRLFRDQQTHSPSALHSLLAGGGDAMGGLAQALPDREDDLADLDLYGLRVAQFKRALRGAGFARGALVSLRSLLTPDQYDELARRFKELEDAIFQELSRLRAEHRRDDS